MVLDFGLVWQADRPIKNYQQIQYLATGYQTSGWVHTWSMSKPSKSVALILQMLPVVWMLGNSIKQCQQAKFGVTPCSTMTAPMLLVFGIWNMDNNFITWSPARWTSKISSKPWESVGQASRGERSWFNTTYSFNGWSRTGWHWCSWKAAKSSSRNRNSYWYDAADIVPIVDAYILGRFRSQKPLWSTD